MTTASMAAGVIRPRIRLGAELPLLLGAVVLLFAGLPTMRHASDSPFGLVAADGGASAAAMCGAIAAFVVSMRAHRELGAVLSVVVVVLVLRLPTVLATEVPVYSWTYKHLGVVDHLMQTGQAETGVDIYAGWPGFFAVAAAFATLTGVAPITVAHVFILLIQLAMLPAMFALFRAAGRTHRVAIVGMMFAALANWVGQDYFAPQSVAFLLAIVVLTLLLSSRRRPVLGWLSVPIFAAIVVTHQLTPYWLVAVTLALGVLGRIRPRGLGLVFGAIAFCWLMLNLDALSGHTLVGAADPVANAQPITAGAGSPGQTLTALLARGLSAVVIGVALLGAAMGLRRRRRRGAALTGLVLAFTSVALLFGQSYGGEAIYRVYLYAIPGCALLAAPLIERALRRRAPRGRLLPRLAGPVAILVGCGAGMTTLQVVDGAWFSNLVDADAVRIAQTAYADVPDDLMLLSPVDAGPGRMTADYVRFARADQLYDLSLAAWPGWLGQDFEGEAWRDELDGAVLFLDRPTYLVVTAQMFRAADYGGLFPPGALDRFRAAVDADPAWVVVSATSAATLYRFEPSEVLP